jgi:hypothetical protein
MSVVYYAAQLTSSRIKLVRHFNFLGQTALPWGASATWLLETILCVWCSEHRICNVQRCEAERGSSFMINKGNRQAGRRRERATQGAKLRSR